MFLTWEKPPLIWQNYYSKSLKECKLILEREKGAEGDWSQIFILDFGQHRRNRAFQSARKNEDRIKLVPGNGNEVKVNKTWGHPLKGTCQEKKVVRK
jgi:hypothetical protein